MTTKLYGVGAPRAPLTIAPNPPAPYLSTDPATGIETVTVTAHRAEWWQDWRVWAGAALVAVLLSRR